MNILALCLAMIEDEAQQHKFEQLYHRYRGLMHHCAEALLHDSHLAEDAVNIAFMQIAGNIDCVDAVDSNRTKRLMVTAVERKAMTLYARQNREYQRTVTMEEVEDMTVEYDNRELELLEEAILKLPLEYQQVILLKYSQEYSSKEIAAILDYSVSKVDQMLSRGRRQLRNLLKEA
ncbi:MAG: sigma-70 family RNA polymerase sigma factor [Peptococcaceae bacterium]|nr:sigma-70 family RNA polymerase sigma factor [Peptococcaceae bacterium]